MDPSAVLAQLNALKLSNGARVGDTVMYPANTPTNVASALMAFMNERRHPSAAPQEQEDTHKSGSGGVDSGKGRGDVDASSPLVALGGRSNTNTTTTNNNNNSNSSGNPRLSRAASGSTNNVKPSRLLRPTPRSQQQLLEEAQGKETVTTPAQPSTTLEQLLRALPSTTIATVREAVPTPPQVAIAAPDKESKVVSMWTVVAGDPTNSKLLHPIDNLNAQKPIIRTAPPCDHRYIIVGDVHGCPEQLEELMLKVNYQQGKDCLILAGDLVNKGPDSVGAVRLAQKLGAIGVLGNHDYTLLSCIVRCRKAKLTLQEERDPVMRLATSFPQECQDYLRSLPHVLRIPKYNVVVVHAGFNLNNPIENQDVFEIMHMRRLEKVGGDDSSSADNNNNNNKKARGKPKWKAVVKGNRGEPWGEHWKGPEFVVFGHDARSGLQEHPFAYGIDTGCVYGHQLTCVVYGPNSPKGMLHSVPGLPVLTNEKHGLPPPAAPVYEQYAEELERQILRPTPRATPPMCANGYKPSFLSVPPIGSPLSSSSGGGGGGGTAKCGAKPCAVERATLLALSKAKELRAISALMSLPLYETAWLTLLDCATEECTTSFWIPFVQGVVDGLLGQPPGAAPDGLEDVLQLALEVCDEVEEVRSGVAAQLRRLAACETSGTFSVSKATAKFLHLMAST